MATDFSKNAVLSSGGFTPNTTNTPIDVRTRVATEIDILSIPNPYIGMIVYVEDTGKRFEILTLKAKQVGMMSTPDAAVDTYQELQFGGAEVDFTGLATEEYVDNAIGEIVIPDVSNFATEEYVDNAIDGIVIPSVSGLASEEYVDNAIADIVIPDVSGFATKQEVEQVRFDVDQDMQERISNLLRTIETLTERITGLEDRIEVLEQGNEGGEDPEEPVDPEEPEVEVTYDTANEELVIANTDVKVSEEELTMEGAVYNAENEELTI